MGAAHVEKSIENSQSATHDNKQNQFLKSARLDM
jgi:hypothetical protein